MARTKTEEAAIRRGGVARQLAACASIALLIAAAAFPVRGQTADPAPAGLQAGDARARAGDFEGALELWERALHSPEAENPLARSDLLVRQAAALRALGF